MSAHVPRLPGASARLTRRPGALVLMACFGAGCAHNGANRVTSLGPSGSVIQEGEAAYYGAQFDGRRTASGEVFNLEKLTAAHRTLPFGTCVRVVNLLNGKSVEVRINDRGPVTPSRIIDLSLAAARALDMIARGVVPVRLLTC